MSDEQEKIKFTADDFKKTSDIDNLQVKWGSAVDPSWIGYDKTNDSEGYTPLCYAAMNGIKPDKIVYLIKNKGCNASRVCSKGKSPLQCAILSGCSESVDALIGKEVYMYDENGELVKSNEPAPIQLQPEKDAAGQPLPARDEDDNIIYKKDSSTGVVYPLEIDVEDDRYNKTERIKHQKCRLIKDGPLVDVPPVDADYNVLYKYEDDGSHTPMRDEDGNPLKQCDDGGNEIHKKDEAGKEIRNKFEYIWDYEYQPEYATAYKNATTNINEFATATIVEADLSEAAKLSKSDILEVLGNKHKASHSPYNYASITDQYGITLLYSACMMSCYASVIYILETLISEGYRATYINTLCPIKETSEEDEEPSEEETDEDDEDRKSALDLSIENGDEGLVEILSRYLEVGDADSLFKTAFAKEWHKVINTLLIKVIRSSQIYNGWYLQSYQWGSGPDKTIISYIDEENDDSVYGILISHYSEGAHFSNFRDNNYYHILAFLFEKSMSPFTSGVISTRLKDSFNQIGAGAPKVVKVLFDRGTLDLRNICSISNDSNRESCIDEIFVTPFDSDLFISLLNVAATGTHRDDVISYLFEEGYFNLNDLVGLSGKIDDDKLFAVFNVLDIALSDIDTNIADANFKTDLISYMFTRNWVSIDDILDDLSSSAACIVINSLYDNDKLSMNDYNIIYTGYRDDLSSINDDLKPLVGKMKFSSSAIESSYFWAYSFKDCSSDEDGDMYESNWWFPQHYQNSVPPITDDDLQDVPGDRYTEVALTNGDTVLRPNKFRLDSYQNKPEFYMLGDEFKFTDSNNGIIVSFDSSVVANKFAIPYNMYSVDSNNVITWNTDHVLYELFQGKRCYVSSNAIAGIIFNNDLLRLAEGDTAVRTFRLRSQPFADVALTFNSNNADHLSISPSSITFTSSNWNSQHPVTFTAIDNDDEDENVDVTISIASSSADLRYDSMSYEIRASISNDDIVLGTLAFISDTFAVDNTEETINEIVTHYTSLPETSGYCRPIKASFPVIYTEFNKP